MAFRSKRVNAEPPKMPALVPWDSSIGAGGIAGWENETHSLGMFYSVGSPQPELLQMVPCSLLQQLLNLMFILTPSSLAMLLALMQAEPAQSLAQQPACFGFLGCTFSLRRFWSEKSMKTLI